MALLSFCWCPLLCLVYQDGISPPQSVLLIIQSGPLSLSEQAKYEDFAVLEETFQSVVIHHLIVMTLFRFLHLLFVKMLFVCSPNKVCGM